MGIDERERRESSSWADRFLIVLIVLFMLAAIGALVYAVWRDWLSVDFARGYAFNTVFLLGVSTQKQEEEKPEPEEPWVEDMTLRDYIVLTFLIVIIFLLPLLAGLWAWSVLK